MKNLIIHKTSQADYEIRNEVLEGKKHLVVPVVMMAEGVHCGSMGAIFHTAHELGKYTDAWNGRPVTINHPEKNGGFVSASADPQQFEKAVGKVFNT